MAVTRRQILTELKLTPKQLKEKELALIKEQSALQLAYFIRIAVVGVGWFGTRYLGLQLLGLEAHALRFGLSVALVVIASFALTLYYTNPLLLRLLRSKKPSKSKGSKRS